MSGGVTLSREKVRAIAALARLELTPEEEALFGSQLSAVLDHVRVLEELDLSGVEPMTHALGAGELPALRPDEARPGLEPSEALANAPAREGTFFKVPRILE